MKGQTLHLTKMLILYLLTTLTPNDHFNAVWYNSRRELLMRDCAGDSFLPATTRNKRLFRRLMERVEERDQASLPPAVNLSFAQFVSVSADEFSSVEEGERSLGGFL